MRLTIAITVLFTALPLAKAAEPARREAYDEGVKQGLAYLARSQASDGSWSTPGARAKDVAVSSLSVMAFLSAGHVPGEGPYGKVVENGVKYIMSLQQSNGLFAGVNQGGLEMYQHGICTLMLAEVVGMMPDRTEAKRLRSQLQLAVGLILKAQVQRSPQFPEDRGGWRYTIRSNDADISVTGWQLMALRAAKNVGCDIPSDPIEMAVAYIKRCQDPVTGGFRYQRYGQVTVACTGTSILALELAGKEHRSTECLRAGSFLLKTPLNPRQQHFFYGIYYTSQAMFQLGENYWTVYRRSLHDLLLRQNPPQEGAWDGFGQDDRHFGPNYCTAMAILALTVEYRFLPIYQRSEEPADNGAAGPKP
jgi:hypothetical protein